MRLPHLDEMRNIGNVDSNLESAVVVLDNVQCVVEIFRRLGIDRKHSMCAQVAANVALSLACMPTPVCEFAFHNPSRRYREELTIGDRPRSRRQALVDALGKVLGREIAVLEERARLRLNVADRAELLDELSERVQRRDRPPLDARDEEPVGVLFRFFDEIHRRLFRR